MLEFNTHDTTYDTANDYALASLPLKFRNLSKYVCEYIKLYEVIITMILSNNCIGSIRYQK